MDPVDSDAQLRASNATQPSPNARASQPETPDTVGDVAVVEPLGSVPAREQSALDETPAGSRSAPKEVVGAWQSSVLIPGMEIAQRYRIVRFVARGGMGEVYEARDEALGERIALKTVAAHDAGDLEALRALKMEVQLARRISHKNVCRIYDLGKHVLPNGSPVGFLTMEFIRGTSLAAQIAASVKLEVESARQISIGILEGLRAAHQAGVIHRDLKSDNVMLRTDREGGIEPVLMDFGLASALNPNESRVSGDQALVGSLAYMAPEQVRGEPLRVATDLYAFGVILFEMLTGRLPFEGPTPAIAAIRRLQEPAPLLRSIDPALPSELERVIARCLERDPKRRYASARAILEALGAPAAALGSGAAQPGTSGSSALGSGAGSAIGSVSSEDDSGRARTGLAISAPMPARAERRRMTALSLVALFVVLPATVWWVSNGAQRVMPSEQPAVTGAARQPRAVAPSGLQSHAPVHPSQTKPSGPASSGRPLSSGPQAGEAVGTEAPSAGAGASGMTPNPVASSAVRSGAGPSSKVSNTRAVVVASSVSSASGVSTLTPPGSALRASVDAAAASSGVVTSASPGASAAGSSSVTARTCPVGLLCPKSLEPQPPNE